MFKLYDACLLACYLYLIYFITLGSGWEGGVGAGMKERKGREGKSAIQLETY